ncbi:metallophosphoesterase [Sphingomonas sp. ST-64]|uniref:Metallophosphoesterase n=1 Tax=Sphingomonas plantiphila TaxID=3163295 RepID=A0ABW8YHJ6_9SPHN
MKRVLLVGIALAFLMLGYGYRGAVRDPIVRRATVTLPDWQSGGSLRVALLRDVHVAGPDMSPARLARIVEQVNALKPDLVLIAGDLVSDKRVSTHRYSEDEAIAPLGGLRARFGVVAVLGNHDHWRSTVAIRRALEANRVTVLSNSVLRRAGLIIAGADDDFTGRADPAALARAVAPLAGPVVALSHSPDIVPALPPRFSLVLAGHTHCGQIALPLIGRPATMSRYGDRFACGLIREGERTIVVGAGLGTSLLPLRIGAPPDLWLLTLKPRAAQQAQP